MCVCVWNFMCVRAWKCKPEQAIAPLTHPYTQAHVCLHVCRILNANLNERAVPQSIGTHRRTRVCCVCARARTRVNPNLNERVAPLSSGRREHQGRCGARAPGPEAVSSSRTPPRPTGPARAARATLRGQSCTPRGPAARHRMRTTEPRAAKCP